MGDYERKIPPRSSVYPQWLSPASFGIAASGPGSFPRTSRHTQGDNHDSFFKPFLLAIAILGLATSAWAVEPLTVNGNKIMAGDQAACFAGNSMFWSNNGWGGERYYNADVVSWLKNDWKAKIVRASMGVEDYGGYLMDPAANKAKVRAVVDAAIANDMYVIIDWHSHHAEEHQAEAVQFFTEMATLYGDHANVIYEVYNEPLNISWSATLKPYAESVIRAIRAIDPDNLIVVGTPEWSQQVDKPAADPITISTNIAYSLHFYNHQQWLRDRATAALNSGIALFVTEWGLRGYTLNDPESELWMVWCREHKISHCNWAVNDKTEEWSILVPGASVAGGWGSDQLTASGTLARDIISNWSIPAAVPGIVQTESWKMFYGVGKEACSDAGGGMNVGWIDAGYWMDYDINVSTAGSYVLDLRVATPNSTGKVEIRNSTGAVLTSLVLPRTCGWQTWSTATTPAFNLPAGLQTIRVYSAVGGWNLNWMEFRVPSSAVPGKVQAEACKAMSGVQTEACSDDGGGLNVGWIDAEDWMDYDVNVSTAGSYVLDLRAASPHSNGKVEIRNSAGTALTSLVLPNTGGWQTWNTATTPAFNLTAGSQTIRVYGAVGGWNLNWMEFRVPPFPTLGKVQAEDWKTMTGVQTEACSDDGGGLNVGWIDADDWMDYDINVPTAGSYVLDLRVASIRGDGKVEIRNAAGEVLASLVLPNTGGWQTWRTATTPAFNLPAGAQTIRVYAVSFGWNLNWLEFSTANKGSASAHRRSTSIGVRRRR